MTFCFALLCFLPHICCCIPCAAPGEGPLLTDYKEHHTDVSVHFDVDLVPGKLAALQAAAGGLEAKFKLSSKISTGACGGAVLFVYLKCLGTWQQVRRCLCSSFCCGCLLLTIASTRAGACIVLHLLLLAAGNMMLFDAEGHIKRYDSPEDILREFFDLRLQFYERRRVGLLQVHACARRLTSCMQLAYNNICVRVWMCCLCILCLHQFPCCSP
jgi:hypothetical protein